MQKGAPSSGLSLGWSLPCFLPASPFQIFSDEKIPPFEWRGEGGWKHGRGGEERTLSLLVRMECERGEGEMDLCNLWRICSLTATGDAIKEKSVRKSEIFSEGPAKRKTSCFFYRYIC